MQTAFRRKQRNLIGLLAILSGAIVCIALYLNFQLQSANRRVSHTLVVMRESDDALLCLMDCETAYRGYLITGKDEYLAPYDKCFKEVDSHIQKLAQLTKANPKQQAIIPQLLELSSEKIKFSQRVIAARKANKDSANWKSGNALINVDTGKVLMDKFRSLSGQIQDEEKRLLAEREQQAGLLAQTSFFSILLLCGAMLAAIGWIVTSFEKFAKAEAAAIETVTKARDEAISSNLLKSQFVANVSHEIRTPLSGMLGICELLSASNTVSDTKELSALIAEAGRNLMTLINDLLDFSKLESGKFTLLEEDFSVELLLHDVTAVMRSLAEKRDLKLSVELDSSLEGSFVGDSYRIRQVLLNLVNNAIKFTKTGEVVVSAKVVKDTGNMSDVRFEVRDTGIGISPDQLSLLFQPYIQADGSLTTKDYGGTGLGLSISKKLAELMNGSMGCESEKGKGSVFWFNVPLKRAEIMESVDQVV